jgi:hypothetical protein
MDARPGDLVGVERTLDAHFLLERAIVADGAAGGDAVRQPQLEDVFRRHVLSRLVVMEVEVRVDEAGHDVHPGEIEFRAAFERRPVVGVDVELRHADAGDLDDPVVRNDDIHRPAGRRARAVDQVHTAEYQALVGTVTFLPRRNVLPAGLRRGNAGQGEHGAGQDRADAQPAQEVPVS